MRILGIFVLLLLAFWTLATSLTQINPGQLGVVRRFGRILPDRPAPGLYIGLPWGIDVVERINVGQVRTVSIGYDGMEDDNRSPEGQLLTGDHNLVNVQIKVDYTVVDSQVDRFLLNQTRVNDLVARTAESALMEWIAARPVDQVLGEEKALLPRWMVVETSRRLQPYALGIRIEQASVAKLFPPEEVRREFEKVAEAKTAIETRRNEANQEANRRQRDAEAEIVRRMREAKSAGDVEVLQARAEARNFGIRVAQFRELSKKQPNLTEVLWLEDMTRLYARMRTTGRIDLLDHYLGSDGITITHFPTLPAKKR
ncbi:MAG: protease modulator HflK [Gemmataceae bacterium]|nr:protease modulator HflK [Gemmataceae bacterium]